MVDLAAWKQILDLGLGAGAFIALIVLVFSIGFPLARSTQALVIEIRRIADGHQTLASEIRDVKEHLANLEGVLEREGMSVRKLGNVRR